MLPGMALLTIPTWMSERWQLSWFRAKLRGERYRFRPAKTSRRDRGPIKASIDAAPPLCRWLGDDYFLDPARPRRMGGGYRHNLGGNHRSAHDICLRVERDILDT